MRDVGLSAPSEVIWRWPSRGMMHVVSCPGFSPTFRLVSHAEDGAWRLTFSHAEECSWERDLLLLSHVCERQQVFRRPIFDM